MQRRWSFVAFVFFVGFSFLVGSCKSGGQGKPDKSLTDKRPGVPGYFEEIPADTLYAYTGMEPFPKEVAEATLEQIGDPITDDYIELLESAAGDGGSAADVLLAFAQEFQGNLNPEGLAKLGLKLDPHFAVYGIGGLPVMRLEVGDTEAFEAMLNRVETKSDVDVTMKEQEGVEYRLYQADEVRLPVVVRDGHVVAGFSHEKVLDDMLPYILGQKKPEKSLADTGQIDSIVEKYDYEKFGVGFFDVRGMIRTFSGVEKPDAVTQAVFEATGFEPPEQSDTCKEEIGEIADSVPRMVIGMREFTPKKVRAHGGIEIESDLASDLEKTVEPVPGIGSDIFEQSAVALGFGVNMKTFLDMTRARAQNIANNPYECEALDEANRWAKRFKNRPVPPVVEQLRGAAFMLQGLEFGSRSYVPKNVEAIAFVRMKNPQSLLGRLKPVVPGLMKTDVKDDGVPVALQQLDQMVSFLKVPHIALKDDALAFSAGVGMQDEMAVLLENPTAEATRTAMAFTYNLSKIGESLPKSGTKTLERLFGSSFTLAMSGSSTTELLFESGGIFFETRTRIVSNDTKKKGASNGEGAASKPKKDNAQK